MRFALALLFAAACSAQTVPTPESVLGHKPGDDFYLANYDETRAYLHKLAAASDRIKIISVGKTTRGLDWEVAIISSPSNLASLDKFKDISRRLASSRGLTDEAAHALARSGKAIVHIDGGMHSSEVAGAQQSISLAYKLIATRGDPEVNAILDNVILMLWTTLNPDGQNEVVDWYRKNLGTSFEVSPLPDLYQEYVGHDNNRDGYMNNMLESREVTAAELDWDPVIFYCHHQTAPFPTRIFIPPFTEPISSNIHPLMARWLNVLGMNIAAYLDEHEMPGAVHRVGFDNWYPGFLDFTHIFRNSISFFTETALYRYATPHFFTVDEFPRERQDLRAEMFYSSPWKGGWWRLADAVQYMQGASMSVLDTAAKYHEELLYNRYLAGRDNIRKYRKEPPFAYVIPREQRDLPTAAVLAQKLMLNGIEVHQTASFTANGREYKNPWVVMMDQPFSPLVKELMEAQHFPDLRTTPNGPPVRPYDVAGWTLPMQMGVEVDAVLQPVTEEQRAKLQLIEKFEAPVGSVEGSGAFYTMSAQANTSYSALNEALAGGGQAAFAGNSIVVSGLNREAVTKIAAKNSAAVQAVSKAPDNAVSLRAPRVGIYRSWTGNIDEGWTRWILENYGFHPVTLRNGDIQAGHLGVRFDAIIIPDGMPRGITDGFAPGTLPGQYTGGIGDGGAEALRDFVNGGGTLIAFNNASLYAISALTLPVTNIVGTLTNDQFYCSGSLLKVETKDVSVAGLRGLPSAPIVMFERGPVFETKAGFRGTVLATYLKDRNPLMSGYLLHPEQIQGKAAAVQVSYGSGRVYLFGFRPQWRGQSHGTYKFVFNAIYDSPATARTTTPILSASTSTPANSVSDPVTAVIARVHADLAGLLRQSQTFSAAKGPKAIDERGKLLSAVDQFQKDDISQVQDLGSPRAADYLRQLRKLTEDLRTKEFDAITNEELLEKYGLPELERTFAAPRVPAKP